MVERGLASSRTKAQGLVLAGLVRVNGHVVTKAGLPVQKDDQLELLSGPRFVSRGGEKLAGALADFGVSPEGAVCLDIGASTGGFTDCLLKHGASLVYSVDVGRGQLDFGLRQDPRVKNMEETHVLNLTRESFSLPPMFAVIDVSFISLRSVLPHMSTLMPPQSTVLPMVKPQFEVGAKYLKKGVVRSVEIRENAVNDIIEFAKQSGFNYLNHVPAGIKGPKGNQEYFLHLKT